MAYIIDGGILAGGLATRMGKVDKGLELFLNQPMVEHISQSLSPYVRQIIINCNRNEDKYQRFGTLTCKDSISGYLGPLAGILSIMQQSDADIFMISPCDTPLLGESFGAQMVNAVNRQVEQQGKQRILIASRDEKHRHPLHLCISRDYMTLIEESLKAQNNKVMRWMFDNDAHWIEFATSSSTSGTHISASNRDSTSNNASASNFVNFNTLEELQTANAHYAK